MADKKISELTNITGANLADTDEFVVVDASANETKAITYAELKKFNGTVTADGLITDTTNGVKINTSSTVEASWTHVDVTGTSTINVGRNSTWGGELIIQTDTKNRANFASNGDISFYEDTGTTPKFFWDASAESLGIGTSSPLRTLDVQTSSGDADMRVYAQGTTSTDDAILYLGIAGTSATTRINFGDGGDADAGRIIYGHSGDYMSFTTAATEAMRIDSSGNVGIGVTPETWQSGRTVLQFGTGSIVNVSAFNLTFLGENYYVDAAGTFRYIADGAASAYGFTGGLHQWYSMPTGTAGSSFTLSEKMRLDSSGNLLLGGSITPASATDSLAIFNGTAPTGSVTDGVVLYAEDVSSSSELKVRDEAGNVTTLSPHNFELIPEGPSEDMAWSYYSERDGRRINVDMLKAIRLLEQISGEKLVHMT